MNPNLFKIIFTLGLSMVMAVFIGYSIAMDDYETLIFVAFTAVLITFLIVPGYIPLLTFGLITPFSMPFPLISGFPILLTVLGICALKYFAREWMPNSEKASPVTSFKISFLLLFGWVLFRWSLRPVLPNFKGFGENVTGFRSYLNYGLSFALVVLLGKFIRTRADILKLFKWLVGVSLFYILLFLPLVFTKSLNVTRFLQSLSLFVTFYDNGWLRFVVLPGFGLNLLLLFFFPNLLPMRKLYRWSLFFIGCISILIGGNRTSLGMAFAMLLVVTFARRLYARLFAFSGVIALCLILFNYIGEHFDINSDIGFLRVLSLVSNRIAERTGADENLTWREIRWKRAWADIQVHPWLGKGYGGLENAFIFGNRADYQDALVEIDLYSGNVHNGYISTTWALGIPATLIIIFILISRLIFSLRECWRNLAYDPVTSDLHCWVLANLAGLTIAIFFGSDLNEPLIWFYLGLSVIAEKMQLGNSPKVIQEENTNKAFVHENVAA